LLGVCVLAVPDLVDVPALLPLDVVDEVVEVLAVTEDLVHGPRPSGVAPSDASVELEGGFERAVGAQDASVWVAGVCDGGGWILHLMLFL